ncbi:MAG: hypothetical protein ACREMB_21670 [Candidatus Rokuibacteriota bacterium]
MTRTVMQTVVALTLTAGLAAPAWAQPPATDLGVIAPPPPTPELGLEPTQPPEEQGSREQEFYPDRVRSRHAPAFVTPFVATVPTSRTSGVKVGLSGWTAPAVPFDMREASGGVAFGISVVWDVPVAAPPTMEPGGAGDR